MSTTIKDIYRHSNGLNIWEYGNPTRVQVRSLIGSDQPYVIVSRADFLSAVEAELNVRLVLADSIVIDRATMPPVTWGEDGYLRVGAFTYDDDDCPGQVTCPHGTWRFRVRRDWRGRQRDAWDEIETSEGESDE